MSVTQFQAGRTYQTRSFCDYNMIISVTIAKRTAKTVTSTDGKTFRPYIDMDGIEVIRPWGSYSMSPIMRADRLAA